MLLEEKRPRSLLKPVYFAIPAMALLAELNHFSPRPNYTIMACRSPGVLYPGREGGF